MPPLKRLLAPQTLCRLGLAVLLVVSLIQVQGGKPPWKTSWSRQIAEGGFPKFKEHVQAGLWYGAAARAAAAAALLILSLAWRPARENEPPIRLTIGGEDDARLSPAVFFSALAIIVTGALALAWPRMTQSFWGDEADAVATYVHGVWKPVNRADPQGPLQFAPVSWTETIFSAAHGPNNHVFYSVLCRLALQAWHALAGQPEPAFAEWPCRVPPLIAGLGTLALLALLLRRWGAPRTGLLAALMTAVHPWHVRYCTEARGYSMMLFFLLLLLHVITTVLERGRSRDWVKFAIVEFLLMWTWAGLAHVLVLLNIALGIVIIVRGKDRRRALVPLVASNLAAAAAFISLYLPIVFQVMRIKADPARSGWMTGRPMDAAWLHNLLAQPFTGIPYHAEDAANASELSWQRLFDTSPLVTASGFGLILALSLAGLGVLWRRNRTTALLVTAIFSAVPVIMAHFYYVLKMELLAWYLLFSIPWLALCEALGAETIAHVLPARLRRPAAVALTALMMAAVWPMTRDEMMHPVEDYRGALLASRGRHEPPVQPDSSNVFTVWLWRFSQLYDPRGDTHVRDAKAMRQRMNEAKQARGELYVIVGYRSLAESLTADVLAMLDDAALFERRETFHAQEALHTLTVYRMK